MVAVDIEAARAGDATALDDLLQERRAEVVRYALTLEGPTTEDQLVDHQLRRRLARILSELDPAMRDVLIRRDVLGETATETAAALGISVAAMKSRLHRARAEVKHRLLSSLGRREGDFVNPRNRVPAP